MREKPVHIGFIILILVGILITACGCAGPVFTKKTNVSAAQIFAREITKYCAQTPEKRRELDYTFRYWLPAETDVLVKCPDEPRFFD